MITGFPFNSFDLQVIYPHQTNAKLMDISQRELQVLVLITQELSTPEIAERLFLSAETVKSHRKSIIRKFQVKNTAGIVRRAFELGLLSIYT